MSSARPVDAFAARSQLNARQARILDAASRCFAEKGFQAATIVDVAEAAGVSRPLVYKYFGDKDGLIDAVLESTFADWQELNDRLRSRLARDVRTHPAPPAASGLLEQKFDDALGFVRERPLFRAILQQDPQLVVRGHLEALRQSRRASAEATRAILRHGIASGEFRDDLDEETATGSVEMVLFALLERALGLRPEIALEPSLVRTTLQLLGGGLVAAGRGS